MNTSATSGWRVATSHRTNPALSNSGGRSGFIEGGCAFHFSTPLIRKVNVSNLESGRFRGVRRQLSLIVVDGNWDTNGGIRPPILR